MQVLLLNPRRSAYTGESISAPHEGLLSLAATLREGTFFATRGTTVTVADDQLSYLEEPCSPPGASLPDREFDIVGVQAVTATVKNAAALLWMARRRSPEALTVMGGVHPTQSARSLVAAGAADVVVHGEGEVTFAELCATFGERGRRALPSIAGITFRRDDGQVVTTPGRRLIEDLDALPLPARDLVDMNKYMTISAGRSGNLITSRGCSYTCSYCYSRHHWAQIQRRRSVARVIEEIEVMQAEFGIERIRIEDDDFLEDRRWVTEFCRELRRRRINRRLEWDAHGRPDHIDDGIAAELRDAGCFRLLLGVETMDSRLLRVLNRGGRVTPERIEGALDILREQGIHVQACQVLGIPGESIGAIRRTLDWLDARLDDRDIMTPTFFVPFHGGVEASMKRAHEYTVHETDPDHYSGHAPVASSPAASIDELRELFLDCQVRRKWRRLVRKPTFEEVRRRLLEVTSKRDSRPTLTSGEPALPPPAH